MARASIVAVRRETVRALLFIIFVEVRRFMTSYINLLMYVYSYVCNGGTRRVGID